MHSIRMTTKELHRLQTLQSVGIGQMNRKEAAGCLEISLRQVDRLRKKLRLKGPEGLAHGNRGQKSNNKLAEKKRKKALSLLKENYADFGPTLAAEKLLKNHKLKISKETVRKLMKEEGMWKARPKKEAKYHPRRPRRSHFGDLIQADGSHHAWFEDRGAKCVLIAFIDDATNRAYGKFFEGETLESYVEVFQQYLKKYGKPKSFYVDKDSIFRVNKIEATPTKRETQFGRMMKELGVQLICAHSPEAKGRIERLFGTLQDRLVKEMRLLKINCIEDANKYLDNEYWNEFNARWSLNPEEPEDFHENPPSEIILDRIFAIKESRKVSKSLDFSYKGMLYQIRSSVPRRIANKPVQVFERFDGSLWVEYEERKLDILPLKDIPQATPIKDSKQINAFINRKKRLTFIERHRRGIATLR